MRLWRSILSVVVVMLGVVTTQAQTMEQIIECGLPVVVVTTVDGEEPSSEIVYAPEGENGVSLINKTNVPGRVQILVDGDVAYDSGDYADGESGMKIRHRGNTSAQWAKKPYRIKLEKKADLLLRDNDSCNDKEWALMCGYELNTVIGFYMNKLMQMQWAPEYMHVNLVVNGDYRGVYVLAETTKRNADARIDVDKNSGYIIERDPYWWNEDLYFRADSGDEFTFKYPKNEDVTPEQVDYITDYINKVEASITDGTYDEYIDTESFARWLLGHDIMGTRDAGGSNIFLTKYDDTDDSRLMMANMWDFDTIFGVKTYEWTRIHTSDFFWFNRLLNNTDRTFAHVYRNLWSEYRGTIQNSLTDMLDEFVASDASTGIANSLGYEMERWQYFDAESPSDQVGAYKTVIAARLQWIDTQLMPLIEGINSTDATDAHDDVMYNLAGQKVENPRPGIYIRGGRKIVVAN